MLICNHVTRNCNAMKRRKKRLSRENIFEVLQNMMQQNTFYYIFQCSDGNRNAV